MDNEGVEFMYDYFEESEQSFFGVGRTRFHMDNPENMTWWLAYAGDNFVGCCAAEYLEPHIWYLRSSLVPKVHRGHGIYRQLFDARMLYVLEQNPLLITVISSPTNKEMYNKLDFKPLADYTGQAGYNGYNELFMYKNINPKLIENL